ncbi:SH3 domain-containing protein [Flavobacterium sp. GN10]|uniref:SH3 domain-containing protein n=1 Tax=Flavobacterium tagetis TaxID=2801336 RepID=A0ABS1KES3_9FLAO|nr:SH3 domain-containing protein [Flavobacterium tagetis]MBL0737182.1 SH3 domain-containing protein [Flavobacterium tagetis]
MENLKRMFLALLLTMILSCEKKNDRIEFKKQNIVIEKDGLTIESIKFSDLFNEGSIIKFAPKDLVDTNDAEILEFKRKLSLYEKENPLLEDFDPENLKILINHETFSESNQFINSEWLDYYIKKYHLENYLKEIMKKAIEQEDYQAVKVLLKNGYIVSLRDVNIAKETKKESDDLKKINLKNNGLYENGDPTFYDSEASKIDDILKFLDIRYNQNKIYDKDGFTNLRENASTNSKVVIKINSGEHIIVLDNIEKDVEESQKGWCLVENKDGQKGYIHKSRIVSN